MTLIDEIYNAVLDEKEGPDVCPVCGSDHEPEVPRKGVVRCPECETETTVEEP